MPIENRHFRRAAVLGAGIVLSCISPAVLMAADAKPASPYRLQWNGGQTMGRDNSSGYVLDRKYRPAETAPMPIPVGPTEPAPPPLSESLDAQPFSREIARAAAKAAIDPVLVHAVIFVESRYHPTALSLKGAIGLMQVLPETASRYGVKDPSKSPQANLRAGTLYLSDLIRTFDNRLDLALAAYNAGEGAVLRYRNKIPPFPETQQYVRDVLAKYNEWHNIAARRDYYLTRTRAASMEAAIEKHAKPFVPPYLAGTRLVQSETMPTAD
jgi:soluble lytic murein transglycosylase-like protein